MPMIRRRTLSEDAHELRQLVMGDAHFVPILLMTLVSLLMSVMEGGRQLMQVLTVLLFAATLLLSLWRSGVSTAVFRACALLCAVLVVLSVVGSVSPTDWVHEAAPLTMAVRTLLALVILITFAVVLRAAVRQRRVTLDTLAAALTSYLLIGIFFSLVFRMIQGGTDAFFAQTITPTSNDFIYFSFVTLTTTGYGDLTPAAGVPRGAVVFEVILGQVYLVTIISLVVSHLGRERTPGELVRRMKEDDAEEQEADDSDAPPQDSPESPGNSS